MDLSNLNYATFPLELAHPATNQKVGLTLNIRSAKSPEVKSVMRRIANDVTRKRVELKLNGVDDDDDRMKNVLTEDESARNEIDIYFACVESWEWTEDGDGNQGNFAGEQIVFNRENFELLLEGFAPATEQIDDALDNVKNFFTS